MLKIAWIFFGWLGLAFPSLAASFDCKKALSATEKMICASSQLSEMDTTMSKAYSNAIKSMPKGSLFHLQQREWIRERNKCVSEQCLVNLYFEHIFRLQNESRYVLFLANEMVMCLAMLDQYNRDIFRVGYADVYGALQYSGLGFVHTEYGGVQSAIFDINNDETDELVVKKYRAVGKMGMEFSSEIYIYPKGSTVIEDYQGRKPWEEFDYATPNRISLSEYRLTALPSPHPVLEGPIYVGPFRFGGSIFVSLTSIYESWIVISKYMGGDKLQDICYFRDTKR